MGGCRAFSRGPAQPAPHRPVVAGGDDERGPRLLLTADMQALRIALVRGGLTIPAQLEPRRVAIVHALADSRPGVPARAVALVAALRRQAETDLADRVRQAL
jgi:hypothetical protein